ncbi:uncharacterized protein BJ212DRAFT_1484681 [Suillus subaureus]|uniref:Ricin B lectin domain-containing protein n=1 Tax=Suillus subaureus TaxID=48587 RepID=A0A9P7E225_9AGAM|nr:uncharacterized protein BJ212DRAFT_1484681 [Suillus subaureus]KAG1809170.1 hypothetical protein BJ212DRAFT_1484681 [Suillus subaureus]
MPLPPADGVYTIRNIGRGLLLDLKDNRTDEGNKIQGYSRNDTKAQEWVMKRQESPDKEASAYKTYSIQSNNNGYNGNGCFATANQEWDEPVVYTRQSILVDLVERGFEENFW